jgi:predicted phosphodiesterase
MRLQLLSDLHLETEVFEPTPAPGAELLVLAGDIDSRWDGLAQFAGWPVPVLFVAGNHEFDGRDLLQARAALRERCTHWGIRFLECESALIPDRNGRQIRFVGTTRWCDFDLFGPPERERSMRAARHYMKVMRATRGHVAFDATAVREEALACRSWLAQELERRAPAAAATVVVTHFAPSLRSADPRYGAQPGTASFCNADDDLMPGVDLWIHGHLHCPQDYRVEHVRGHTRVVCNARGHARKGEHARHAVHCVLEV